MKARFRVLIGVLAASFAFAGVAAAQTNEDKLKKDVLAFSKRIDDIIEKRLAKEKVKTAPPAKLTEYFRRLNLDLIGRIPEYLDVLDFLEDDRDLATKRWLWVEKFLNNEKYVGRYTTHFANIYRDVMIVNQDDNRTRGFVSSFHTWLEERIKKNVPYHKIAYELLTTSPYRRVPGANPAIPRFGGSNVGSTAAFYQSNENKPENLADATARIFLGVKIGCAQCHAHPFAEWKQEQFWEFAAFFSGNRPTVRLPGQPAVNPNPLSKSIKIPGTKTVVQAKFLDGKSPKWKAGDDPVQKLANWVIAKENPFFAKAAVDTVWTYFFGISLLEPIYEPDDDSIAHKELIDEMAKTFAEHNYDLKFLIRAIVHTKAYQRTSRSKGKAQHGDIELFARMPVRAMSPEQLYDSLVEALDIEDKVQNNNPTIRPNPFNPQTPRAKFLAKFSSPEKRNERQTSILQALFMMNGQFLAQHTKLDNNDSLKTIATTNTPTDGRIWRIYMIALSRYPTPAETKRLVKYIESGGSTGNRAQAVADVYWALLNSGEFMLNH